jgi:hypothetical protein
MHIYISIDIYIYGSQGGLYKVSRFKNGFLSYRPFLGLVLQSSMALVPTETNQISTNGNPTLSTSVVVPGGLTRAIPVSAISKTIQKDKNRIVEYNIYFITLIRVHLFGTCRVQVHRD